MSNTFQNLLPSFFFAGQDDKNTPAALRQKIALAMLMQKKQYPKNVGEGLSSFGESIGQALMARGVQGDAAAAERAGQAARDEFSASAAPLIKSSYAPTSDVQPSQPSSPLSTIQSQHPDMTQPAPPLITTPPTAQPASTMFQPDSRAPGLNTPQQPPSMLDPRLMATPPQPQMPGPQAMVAPEEKNAIDTAADTDPWAARSRAIAGIESGGARDPYSLMGARTRTGDQAIGKYQIMGANVPSWTQASLGRSMTPEQFRADPGAQEAVFRDKFGEYANRYGDAGAAKAWFAGEQGMRNPNATDVHGRLTVAGYGNDFVNRLRAAGGQPTDPREAITASLVTRGGPGPGVQANALVGPAVGPAGLPPEITAGRSQPDQRLAFNGTAQPPVPGGLRAAPPPQSQVRQMPPPDQAVPGYVTPLKPTPVPPPTMTETMARIQDRINRTPPSEREAVERYLMPLYEQEKAKLARQHEAYKDELIQQRAIELQHHKDQADRAARINAAREAEQRIKKGEAPEVKQDVETGLTYNTTTGQWEQPKIAGADPDRKPTFKGTEFQGKALVNYGRGNLAQEGLLADGGKGEKVLSDSPLQSALSSTPVISGMTRTWRSDDYKEADTHAENFVQAFVRQLSGANIPDVELEKEARSMIPRYGDTEKQLQSKREQRDQFLSGLHSAIGTSGQKIVEIDARKRAEERERAKEVKQEEKIYDFPNEAEAAKANLPRNTRVRINGRIGKVQ